VVVGYEKPDVRIFEAALAVAGITPIHFDPLRGCRATDHRHVRALAGIWQHVIPGALGKKRPPS